MPSLRAGLDQRLLNGFKEWFQEDLAGVKLFLYSRLDSRRSVQAPLAFATANSIFLSDIVARSGSGQRTCVLAHEFAHIVQKKRGQAPRAQGRRTWTTAATLEEEADSAACAFLTGRKCPGLSADPAATPRAWGPAGHFYTVYWVARLAGVPDNVAERLAFYTQMPDQVSNFDAKTAGVAWASSAFLPAGPIRGKVVGGEDRFDHAIYRVQSGLHCLNGRPSEAESNRRASILRKLPGDQFLNFSFGLGLHALGDSYAHRRGDGTMFMAPIGHGFAGQTMYERIVKAGTEIDNINEHTSLYSNYCAQMLDVIADRFNPSLSADDRFHSRPELGKKIADATSQPEEDGQIATMMKFYPDRRSSYTPESDPVPWDQFRMRHPSETADWMVPKAQALAELWTL